MINVILKSIKQELTFLESEKQRLFAVLMCEKLFPQYEYYARLGGVKGTENLKAMLDSLYRAILDENILPQVYKKYKNVIEELCPDLDQTNLTFASYGFDVCIAFDECLDFMFNKNIEHLLNLASIGRNIVDMYVQEKNNLEESDKDLDKKIFSDPYMKNELERQSNLIMMLKEVSNVNSDVVAQFRLQNSNYGSIIDLAIL